VTKSLILTATERLSTLVATRSSRRSFIARSPGLVSIAAVGSGVMTATARAAFLCDSNRIVDNPTPTGCGGSRTPPCGAGDSVSCGHFGSSGTCPSGTNFCGDWLTNCPQCASGLKIWSDCCAANQQCAAASSCVCVTDTDNTQRAHCCFAHQWVGGTPGDCSRIYCRTTACSV
jgi:hypothetical protein